MNRFNRGKGESVEIRDRAPSARYGVQ